MAYSSKILYCPAFDVAHDVLVLATTVRATITRDVCDSEPLDIEWRTLLRARHNASAGMGRAVRRTVRGEGA